MTIHRWVIKQHDRTNEPIRAIPHLHSNYENGVMVTITYVGRFLEWVPNSTIGIMRYQHSSADTHFDVKFSTQRSYQQRGFSQNIRTFIDWGCEFMFNIHCNQYGERWAQNVRPLLHRATVIDATKRPRVHTTNTTLIVQLVHAILRHHCNPCTLVEMECVFANLCLAYDMDWHSISATGGRQTFFELMCELSQSSGDIDIIGGVLDDREPEMTCSWLTSNTTSMTIEEAVNEIRKVYHPPAMMTTSQTQLVTGQLINITREWRKNAPLEKSDVASIDGKLYHLLGRSFSSIANRTLQSWLSTMHETFIVSCEGIVQLVPELVSPTEACMPDMKFNAMLGEEEDDQDTMDDEDECDEEIAEIALRLTICEHGINNRMMLNDVDTSFAIANGMTWCAFVHPHAYSSLEFIRRNKHAFSMSHETGMVTLIQPVSPLVYD